MEIQQDPKELVPLTDGELELEMPEMEAIALKTLLEANDIEAVIFGASQLPNLPYQVHVPASRLVEATALVRDARQAAPVEPPLD
jgi:hypothetical protein